MKTAEQKVIDELYDRDDRALNELPISEVKVNGQKIPDPKLHQQISFLKSAIRLGACVFGMFGMYELGFLGLFLAEVVGIVEELV